MPNVTYKRWNFELNYIFASLLSNARASSLTNGPRTSSMFHSHFWNKSYHRVTPEKILAASRGEKGFNTSFSSTLIVLPVILVVARISSCFSDLTVSAERPWALYPPTTPYTYSRMMNTDRPHLTPCRYIHFDVKEYRIGFYKIW